MPSPSQQLQTNPTYPPQTIETITAHPKGVEYLLEKTTRQQTPHYQENAQSLVNLRQIRREEVIETRL